MPNSKNKAPRDENRITVIVGVSSSTTTLDGIDFVEGETPVPIAVNPVTGAIKFEAA